MDLTYLEVPVGALDTAIDAAVAPPGTLTICDNAQADTPGIYEKRKGYAQLTSPATTRKLAKRGDALMAVADAFGYVGFYDGVSAWRTLAPLTGVPNGVPDAETTQANQVLDQTADVTSGTRCTANGVTVHAFSSRGFIMVRLVDTASGSVFYEQFAETATMPYMHAVATGNIILVLYTTSGQLLRAVKINTATRAVAAPVTVVSAGDVNAAFPVFDVCPVTATDIIIAHYSNTAPQVRVTLYRTSTMAIVQGPTLAANEVIDGGLSVVATTGEFGAVLYHSTAAGGMRAACFNPATTVQTVAPFSVEAVTVPAGKNCGLIRVDATHVLAVWDRAATGITKQKVQWTQLSSAGAVAALCGPLFNAALASKPFPGPSGYSTSFKAINVWAPYNLQYTYFTVRIQTAAGAPFGGTPSAMHAYRAAYKSAQVTGQLTDVDTLSASSYAFSASIGYKFLSTSSQRAGWSTFGIDYGSKTLYRNVEALGSVLFSSGLVGRADGSDTVETNFALYPEITQATAGAVGAAGMDNGTYSYIAVFEASDANGNTDRSTTSIAVSATTVAGAGLGKVTLTFDELCLSRAALNQTGNLSMFRTTNAGTTYFFIGSQQLTSTQASSTYTDQAHDSTITSNRILYTAGGVLDREPPPPCVQLLLHKNRVWGIDAADRKSLFYSGELVPGEGAWFSSLQRVRVDSGGDITGIATMDDKLIVYKSDPRIFKIYGSGANALGQNSDLSPALPMNNDAGASDSRSIVSVAAGTMYRNAKGLQLISRGEECSFIGSPVQTYVDAAANVTAATLLADAREVRFELDTGVKAVYNYGTNRWTTHTNYLGATAIDAIVVGGVYYWATASGAVYKESATTFLDPASTFVPMTIEFAWVAAAGRQGLFRARKALLLAERKDPHDLTITSSVNYDSVTAPLVSALTNATIAALPREQIRVSLTSQKVESVRVKVVDAVSSGGGATVTGQGYNLRGLAFLAGVKKGAFDKRMVSTAKV